MSHAAWLSACACSIRLWEYSYWRLDITVVPASIILPWYSMSDVCTFERLSLAADWSSVSGLLPAASSESSMRGSSWVNVFMTLSSVVNTFARRVASTAFITPCTASSRSEEALFSLSTL